MKRKTRGQVERDEVTLLSGRERLVEFVFPCVKYERTYPVLQNYSKWKRVLIDYINGPYRFNVNVMTTLRFHDDANEYSSAWFTYLLLPLSELCSLSYTQLKIP